MRSITRSYLVQSHLMCRNAKRDDVTVYCRDVTERCWPDCTDQKNVIIVILFATLNEFYIIRYKLVRESMRTLYKKKSIYRHGSSSNLHNLCGGEIVCTLGEQKHMYTCTACEWKVIRQTKAYRL